MNTSCTLLASDYFAVGNHYLLLERANGSFERRWLKGEELERLEWKLKIVRDVDAYREKGRAA